MMRYGYRFDLTTFLGCACVLALVPAGCTSQPPAEEEARPAPVKAVGARALALAEWTELLGSTQPLPDHVARLSAAVEGRVISVPGNGQGAKPAEGKQVQAGTIIVQLDDQIVRANRAKAEA